MGRSHGQSQQIIRVPLVIACALVAKLGKTVEMMVPPRSASKLTILSMPLMKPAFSARRMRQLLHASVSQQPTMWAKMVTSTEKQLHIFAMDVSRKTFAMVRWITLASTIVFLYDTMGLRAASAWWTRSSSLICLRETMSCRGAGTAKIHHRYG